MVERHVGTTDRRDVWLAREVRWHVIARTGDAETGKVLRWEFDTEDAARQMVRRLVGAEPAAAVRDEAGSPFERFFGWQRLQKSPETDIVPDLLPFTSRGVVLDKDVRPPFTPAGQALSEMRGWRNLYFCGITTESCVLKGAVDAFECNLTLGSLPTRPRATPASKLTLPGFSRTALHRPFAGNLPGPYT